VEELTMIRLSYIVLTRLDRFGSIGEFERILVSAP
jgi:hypothetical protein